VGAFGLQGASHVSFKSFILFLVLLALLAAAVAITSSASTTLPPLVAEGLAPSGVLQDVAVRIDTCRCQQNVSIFHFERTFILTIRLIIYMGNEAVDAALVSAPMPTTFLTLPTSTPPTGCTA
jgi:hypothetical protein